MKVMTIAGTKSEIIRLSLIIKKLDAYSNHVLVHLYNGYDNSFRTILFKELGLREPDYHLDVQAVTSGEQIGKILLETERVILQEKPDRILILGDTISGLVSIIAKRMGIAVFHMEAGNRCFNDRIPEEVNRVITDHCSTILLPYTHRSSGNLRREGINNEVIHVIGNPIYEVLTHYSREIEGSKVLDRLGLKPQNYFLATMHRGENINDEYRFKSTFTGMERINTEYHLPIIFSTSQITREKIKQFNLTISNKEIRLFELFGFFDFVCLEKNAACVITDSGAIQEECCILGTPSITIRDITERPETIECGSTTLTSTSPKVMLKAIEIALAEKHHWTPPLEYLANDVSAKAVKIILGYITNQQTREYS